MLKNRQEREIENANRQLLQYENQLKDIEIKVSELESKNQQYTTELASINKSVLEKEKEVEEMSQKIRDIRLEHGSSDAKQIQLLEKKVREMLQQFFQNCKKHAIRQQDKNNFISKESQKAKPNKNQNQLEDGQDNSNIDLQNLSSDRKFLGQNNNNDNNKQQNKQDSKVSRAIPQGNQSFHFVIKVRNGQQVNDVPIDLDQIQKVSNLRDYLSKTYSIQKEFLFLYDESGNMLLDEMELQHSLFPNVFKTIKNYTPQLTIEVRRHKSSKKDNQNNPLETLMTNNDEQNYDDTIKNGNMRKSRKKISNWSTFLQRLPKILKQLQHLLENLAILALIVLFILNRYISNDVINKFNINNQVNKALKAIFTNNDNPFSQFDTPVFMALVQFGQLNQRTGFTPFLTSVIYQTRFKAKSDCDIPKNHYQLFSFGTSQYCVDINSYDQSSYGDKIQPYFQYSSIPGTDISGFIIYSNQIKKNWEIDSYLTFLTTQWFDFQTYKVTVIQNYFNSPTGMAVQLKMTSTNIVTDRKIANLEYSINSFTVQPESQSEKITSNFITGIASFLLLFALIEYIGIYGQKTANITVQLYKQRKEEYERKKLQEEIDQKEFEKNFGAQAAQQNKKKSDNSSSKLQDHQYQIIDFSWIYILIKRPEFFDVINIISLILLLVQSGIYSSFRSKREGIIKPDNEDYVDFDTYIQDEYIIIMLTAVNTLLLMLSFTKYLASWSFTLKIYSQIMTSFVKRSWAILFVVIIMLLIISFSWMTFISSSIQYHDSFIYSMFLQVKATFFSSFIQELRIRLQTQPEMPPLVKDAVFSPFTLIAMLILQFVIHFCIFSFLASLMANSIHITKERMEKISKEIQDFEKRKVVGQTIFFRKSIKNFSKHENQAIN
ncbi:transmembrane protein, putative (macronuclear) [Tetrahymena thermophila SB210]|uniref:Transmembrane protein, putative n=1 Tax=Tetrahymena thermophila (strain SB210) TaxID=312017 RepID=Q22S03_TETTS|nr:transmembrane protein, putative [Tetrahymena thermophila SB210]EAR87969.3 transmembrane protein, putative [Tetrahymena thermophila SB210]|eukprot:XP_001008214.3 transmembrane protein, putative [Tetrahymena thermophila SB210]